MYPQLLLLYDNVALSKNYDLPTSYSTNKLDNTMLTGQALTVLTSGDVVISCATVYSTTGAVVTEVFSTNNSIGASKVGLQTASGNKFNCLDLEIHFNIAH